MNHLAILKLMGCALIRTDFDHFDNSLTQNNRYFFLMSVVWHGGGYSDNERVRKKLWNTQDIIMYRKESRNNI